MTPPAATLLQPSPGQLVLGGSWTARAMAGPPALEAVQLPARVPARAHATGIEALDKQGLALLAFVGETAATLVRCIARPRRWRVRPILLRHPQCRLGCLADRRPVVLTALTVFADVLGSWVAC